MNGWLSLLSPGSQQKPVLAEKCPGKQSSLSYLALSFQKQPLNPLEQGDKSFHLSPALLDLRFPC